MLFWSNRFSTESFLSRWFPDENFMLCRQIGSNEVKWLDPDVYAGLYIYILEAELEGGKRKQVKNVMEVVE